MFEVTFSFYVSEVYGENSAGYWSEETKSFKAHSEDDLEDQMYKHIRLNTNDNHHHKRVKKIEAVN